MTAIKICGITSVEDAIECARLGANLLGFIFADSPRRADPDTAKHVQRMLGNDVKTVGVFTEESENVLRIMDDCAFTYAQLHGGQSEEFARRIGVSRVIRVARVCDLASLEALREHTEASYYLLDTYRKDKAGGTGETFDWSLAAVAMSLGKPVFVSGGLNPENVFEVVTSVRPYGIDASSGLEKSPGVKDPAKVKEFIENVRKAESAA